MAISGSRGLAPALLALAMMSAPGSVYPAGGGDEVRTRAPAPARQAELVHLVRHDCGSCHGLTLSGGLGPALLPAALAAKPLEYVERVILEGRPGTAMPPWRGLVSDDDVRWIAQQLRNGFPNEASRER
jgi:cytochrome c55X